MKVLIGAMLVAMALSACGSDGNPSNSPYLGDPGGVLRLPQASAPDRAGQVRPDGQPN